MPTRAKLSHALLAIAMRLCNYAVLIAARKTNISYRGHRVKAC